MVKVTIERHCLPNKEAELVKLLVELRSRAMWQRGYHSGETLRSVDDPSLWLVIGTWLDADLWKAWNNSPKRKEITARIAPLLSEEEKVSVFSFVR